jgi:arginyl-tRNA synthetase
MNSIEILHKDFLTFLKDTYTLDDHVLARVSFELATETEKAQFGDIASNAPLMLSKTTGQNPKTLAQTICQQFIHPIIKQMEIAGPGFLNIRLNEEVFIGLAQELMDKKKSFFLLDPDAPKKSYSLEFVSANPTGPLHFGHGRGGIIGDVLGNILSFLGHHVTKEYYINDAGSQITKLGASFKARCLQALGETVPVPEDGYHGTTLIDLAQECVTAYGANLKTFDDSFFCTYAEHHFITTIKQTLTDYGILFDTWFSEKSLHESGAIARALQRLIENNYTYESDGALWFKSTLFGDDKDRVLKKQDGSLTYVAADVAYLLNKIERGATTLIMVLGQDHHSYVTRLKGIVQALGYSPDMLDIILYQLVTLKESDEQVRMSKRAGTGITLNDIIQTVGTDVARFFYLNRKADAHLEFDLTLALKKTDENPVYYLQYALVRAESIVTKAEDHIQLQGSASEDIQNLGDDEQLLIKKMVSLKFLLQDIARHHQTHLLTYYLLELAQLFHRYYTSYKVIDLDNVPMSRTRLAIVKLLSQTVSISLQLIGISRPKKM